MLRQRYLTKQRQRLLRAIALLAAYGGGDALAQPRHTMEDVCANVACVVDSAGAIVGVPGSIANWLMRKVNGRWYGLMADRLGLLPDVRLYFPTGNCTGQAYAATEGELPQYAMWDGSSLWAAAQPFGWASVGWASVEFFNPQAQALVCEPAPPCDGPCTLIGGPAAQIELPTLQPPFSFR
jgi:hypothetical protein